MKTRSKKKTILLVIGIIIGAGILYWLLTCSVLFSFLYLVSKNASVDVNTDITKYEDYIGENALDEYDNKWGMDESIFPEKITADMEIEDYKMVYYNPWDAQYLSYLVVEYDEADFEQEKERLQEYDSTEYLGYYGVTGFQDEYELLAMYADSYHGFVYALSDKEDTIIYVEIIFCNYYLDLEYEEYIDAKYLPVGFDATVDNPYREEKLGK